MYGADGELRGVAAATKDATSTSRINSRDKFGGRVLPERGKGRGDCLTSPYCRPRLRGFIKNTNGEGQEEGHTGGVRLASRGGFRRLRRRRRRLRRVRDATDYFPPRFFCFLTSGADTRDRNAPSPPHHTRPPPYVAPPRLAASGAHTPDHATSPSFLTLAQHLPLSLSQDRFRGFFWVAKLGGGI